jgi:hypothetical protein
MISSRFSAAGVLWLLDKGSNGGVIGVYSVTFCLFFCFRCHITQHYELGCSQLLLLLLPGQLAEVAFVELRILIAQACATIASEEHGRRVKAP